MSLTDCELEVIRELNRNLPFAHPIAEADHLVTFIILPDDVADPMNPTPADIARGTRVDGYVDFDGFEPLAQSVLSVSVAGFDSEWQLAPAPHDGSIDRAKVVA